MKTKLSFIKMNLTKITLLMSTLAVSLTAIAGNPFFETYNTPHQTIPFDEIKTEHFFPAFEEAMKQHTIEVNAIIHNPEAPTFENTVVALERSGTLLTKVSSPFYNLLGSETNDELQEVAEKVSPLLTEHANSIRLNEKLFARVKSVYLQKDNLKLTPEQQMLLKDSYESFTKNGANLSDSDKAVYRKLSKEISLLTLQYGQNVLKETNNYSLLITDKALLSGLPADLLDMLASNAKNAG